MTKIIINMLKNNSRYSDIEFTAWFLKEVTALLSIEPIGWGNVLMKNKVWIPIAIIFIGLMVSANFDSMAGLLSPRFLVTYAIVILACIASLCLSRTKDFPLSIEVVLVLTACYIVLLPLIKLSLDQ